MSFPRADGTPSTPSPGQLFVAVDFVCSSCDWTDVRTCMARVGRNTSPDCDPDPWVQAWKKDGSTYRPKWTDADEMLLICVRCGHAPDPIRRAWVVALLESVAPGPTGRRVINAPC